jgi:hypothetical protein
MLMVKTDKANNDTTPPNSTACPVGDVETAGETVAADTRPVGANTLAKVNDTKDSEASDKD